MAIILGSTSAGTLGTVTMSELKSIIQAEGGYDTDTTAAQTLMIRDVLRRLYGMRRWQFLAQENTSFQDTVANAGIVDLATAGRALMVDSVRATDTLGNSWDVTPADADAVLKYRQQDNATGAPGNWGLIGTKLYFYPVPDVTYNLRVFMYTYSTLPSSDSDSILWPEAHIAVVKYGVMMQLARRQRDDAGYDRIKLDFQEALMEHFRDEGMTQRQISETVRNWGGWDRAFF